MDTELSDEILAGKALAGDDSALEALVERYTSAVYNYARRLCGNDEEAQDITQDALVKVWANLGKFRSEQALFKTWLWRIVRNTVFDSLRKHTRAHTAFSAFDTEDGNALTDSLTDNEPMQDERYAQAEDAAMLEKALQQLPIPARDVLLLRYREELTFDEIGATLDEPLNTVKSRHRRALESLRKIIEGADFPPLPARERVGSNKHQTTN